MLMSGNELHEEGPGGKKQDHRLHEHILGGLSEQHEKKLRRGSRLRAARVLDKSALDKLYGEED